jgi:hypothetical protein
MRRRHAPDATDVQTASHIAQEARWWASRSRVDRGLSPAELARYRALRDQPDDPAAAVDAIVAAAVAAPAVIAGTREVWGSKQS